ncbi:putative exporter [Bradyrhizobium sp. LA6.1]|uniref:hypothetical protein n=1 Tax=Bradyrhizobium sp. LA6.1 TaxID=3156378 RepID=UPI0033912FFA
MDGNKGCTFAMIGIFVLILGVAWLHDQANQRPPMSDAEFHSRMEKQRADRRQRCINNAKLAYDSLPQYAKQHLNEIIERCASDD